MKHQGDASGGGVRGGAIDGPETVMESDGETLDFSVRFNGKQLAHREFDSDFALRGHSATVTYALPDGRIQRYRFLGSPVCDLSLLDP